MYPRPVVLRVLPFLPPPPQSSCSQTFHHHHIFTHFFHALQLYPPPPLVGRCAWTSAAQDLIKSTARLEGDIKKYMRQAEMVCDKRKCQGRD